MLNENVKKLLKENMWDLATCSAGVPNAVPVAFKDVTDDGGVVSAYYQLPGKESDVNRFVLFKVNSKGTITLVYIEGELDSDDLITLLFTKKDL